MKHVFSLVLALAIVMLIVNFVSEGVMPDGVATATQVLGTVRIFTNESPAERLIGINDSIAKNDRGRWRRISGLSTACPTAAE